MCRDSMVLENGGSVSSQCDSYMAWPCGRGSSQGWVSRERLRSGRTNHYNRPVRHANMSPTRLLARRQKPTISSRYFVAAPIETDRAVLADAEAHHLLHVLRARAGDEVTLFDGSGSEF